MRACAGSRPTKAPIACRPKLSPFGPGIVSVIHATVLQTFSAGTQVEKGRSSPSGLIGWLDSATPHPQRTPIRGRICEYDGKNISTVNYQL